jgi:cell wall-associated NlpC family hydrolase
MRALRFAPLLAALLSLPSAARAQHAPRSVRAVAPAAPASPVVAELRRVAANLRSTRYAHGTRIDERAGRYDFDCSAMATFVLARSAPRANAAVMRRNGRGRPVARDFHDVIAASPADRPREGWLRLARAQDLRPGDVIAWRRPPSVASRNTGHVAFVIGAPRRIDREGRRYLVRVADSTSIPHGDDTRPRAHRSGFGYGNLTLFVETPGADPTAYGWYGLDTRIDFRTHIALGRPVR